MGLGAFAVAATGALAGLPGLGVLGPALHAAAFVGLAVALGRPETRQDHWAAIGSIGLWAAVFGGWLWLVAVPIEPPEDYQQPYAGGPYAPSELAVVGDAMLAPGALTGSLGCGAAGCHEQITRQWEASAHRWAGTDPFYRFAVSRSADDYGTPSTRLCAACHEPAAVLALGVDDSVEPDRASRHEGVTCLVCHLTASVRDVAPHGVPANGSLVLAIADPVVARPHGPLTPFVLRRHGELMRRPTLSTNRFCAACHQFFIPPAMGAQPAGRLRLQVAEAAGTRFEHPDSQGFKSCVDCHMPLVEGDDPAAEDGRIHDHRALGGNVMIPHLAGDSDQAAAVTAFRATGGLMLTLGDAQHSAGRLTVPVTIWNPLIGHDFPTGATDISQVWVEADLVDAQGGVVARSPGLGRDGFLHPETRTLSTVALLPGGEPDFLHDLFDQVALHQHPRVKAGGSQTLPVTFDTDKTQELSVRARLRFRRGNERWNTWTFNFDRVALPVTDLAHVDGPLRLTRDRVTPAEAPSGGPGAPGSMAWIPAGEYTVGAAWDDPVAEPEEKPAHRVQLGGVYIDRLPITHAQWLAATRRDASLPAVPTMYEDGLRDVSWTGGAPTEALMDTPVVLVTAIEAEAYCQSVGKRLPTEAEWEVAARGRTAGPWAFGARFDAARCNTSEAGVGTTERVGSRPENASPFGVLDMGCNVSEWVADELKAYPSAVQPDNRDDWFTHFGPGMRVVRGASFLLSSRHARVTGRAFEHEAERKIIGFRCAQDPSGGSP